MHIGSLKKRMIKLSKRIHRSLDGSPQAGKLESLIDEFEASIDDAHKALGDGRGKADKALEKAIEAAEDATPKPKAKPKKKK